MLKSLSYTRTVTVIPSLDPDAEPVKKEYAITVSNVTIEKDTHDYLIIDTRHNTVTISDSAEVDTRYCRAIPLILPEGCDKIMASRWDLQRIIDDSGAISKTESAVLYAYETATVEELAKGIARSLGLAQLKHDANAIFERYFEFV